MFVRVGLVFLAIGVILGGLPRAYGQEKAKKVGGSSATADFDAQFVEWKKVLAELKKNTLEYRAAKPDDREKLLEQREEILARGIAMEPKIKKAAQAAYLAAPNKNSDVTLFIESMASDALIKDKHEEALRLCNLLIDNGYPNKSIYSMAGRAAFNSDDFDTAAKDFKIAQDAQALEIDPGQRLYSMVEDYQKKWQKESEIRAAEAKADDLPQVKLKTSKGDIVVELFENEAPNTVANFISLVEKGFYNDTSFHRVLEGFVAQGGDPKGDGKGGPGYTIPCECAKDDHRLHFRGSLSMAHSGKDTGGSQFFLTYVPTGHLDGRHTVFGRIIAGLDVLSELQRRNPDSPNLPDPDKIIDATVLRKRKHKYDPATLSEKP